MMTGPGCGRRVTGGPARRDSELRRARLDSPVAPFKRPESRSPLSLTDWLSGPPGSRGRDDHDSQSESPGRAAYKAFRSLK